MELEIAQTLLKRPDQGFLRSLVSAVLHTAAAGAHIMSDSFDDEDLADTDERLPYSQRTYQEPSPPRSPRSPKHFTELAERLNFLKQLADNRTNLQRQQRLQEEMQQCTFRPEINEASPRRTLSQFLASQQRFQTTRLTKIQHERQRLAESESDSLSRVELSPGSKAILAQRSFHHLSKPALTPSPSSRAVNRESAQVRTLEHEVEAAWIGLQLLSHASYLDLGRLLAELQLMTGSESSLLQEAWIVMNGQQLGHVDKETLVDFLCALNNLPCKQLKGKHIRARFGPLLENKIRAHTKAKSASLARKDEVRPPPRPPSSPGLSRMTRFEKAVKQRLNPKALLSVTLPSGARAELALLRDEPCEPQVRRFSACNGLSQEDEAKLLETLQEHVK